jgi:hypothetical protein
VLGQNQDEVEQQLRDDDTDTPSHKTAKEYVRLGGRRLAKIDDNIVSTRSWEGDPVAVAACQALIEPLDEQKRQEVIVHKRRVNPIRRNFMADDKKDQGSDASRSDPDTAESNRKDLKKQAEQGIERAMRGDL